METHEKPNHRTIKPIQFGSTLTRLIETGNLSIKELAHPNSETLLAILINENKRLDVENIELKVNSLKYHDQEIENAVLKEKLRNALNNSIATTLFIAFGGIFIGLAPTMWSINSLYGVMFVFFGVLFMGCGVILDMNSYNQNKNI